MTPLTVARAALVCALVVALGRGSSATHDLSQETAGSGGAIGGVVMTTDATPQPVARALVSLAEPSRKLNIYVLTDEQGRFRFEHLPPGRFLLQASRPSYVPIAFGASRPGRPGAAVVLSEGQAVAGLTVLLARGAVITGSVRSNTGEAMSGMNVQVLTAGSTSSPPRALGTQKTDDLGTYRFFGLAQGTYVIAAAPPLITATDVPTDAEVDAKLQALQRRRVGGVAVAAPTVPQHDLTPEPAWQPRYGMTPVYHPDVFSPDEAVRVVVAAGEERSGIDIAVRPMFAATVEGRVAGADLNSNVSIMVNLVGARRGSAVLVRTAVNPGGMFRLDAVAPARYVVTAELRSKTAVDPADGPCAFAQDELVVAGNDIGGLLLQMRPCLQIAGRVERATTSSQAPDFDGAFVILERDPLSSLPTVEAKREIQAPIDPDGTFSFSDGHRILPGPFRLSIKWPARATMGRPWVLQSATSGGQDVLDGPLDLSGRSPDTTHVVLLVSDQSSSLSGTLEQAGERVPSSITIVAFTTNRAWWQWPSRRVRAARPATNGEFTFDDLPPGEYYVAALSDLAPDDWLDADFLSEVAAIAGRVTIGSGEHRVQNLRIGR